MMKTALVLGASGNFGRRAAEALSADGWVVNRYQRGTDMIAAAKGADLIVNGLNPPRYHNWAKLIPEFTASVIAAGQASGATVLIPGNVYVYGREPAPWGPATPHRPVRRKGQIRKEMEATYRDAAARGMQTIILRAGDFIDPDSPETMLRLVMLKGLAKGKVTAMGPPEAAHAWAWLPDLGHAAAALADRRDSLPAFYDIPFPGLTFSAEDLRSGFSRLMRRDIRLAQFPWWTLRLASPFWELGRELVEMRYLNEVPHWLDPVPFQRLLPDFQSASFDAVLEAHLPKAA